jgi:hypothetical protein
MRNLRSELEQILDEGKAVSTKARHIFRAEPEDRIRHLLQQYQPVLMFYGIFNAGKSTLVNALLSEEGREIAPVGAGPTTSKVECYRFGDYELYDTPGIDAPIEHERLAKEHLQRSHLVVFVLSSRGHFDEQQVVDEMASILQIPRDLVIVINDKDGYGIHSEPVLQGAASLLNHLRQRCGNLVDGRVKIALVDALGGLEARAARSPKRLERSGVPALAELILERLVDLEGARLLVPPACALQEELRLLQAAVDKARLEGDPSLERLHGSILQRRRTFLELAHPAIDRIGQDLVPRVVDLIKADGLSNQALERLVGDFSGAVEACLGNVFEQATVDLGEDFEREGFQFSPDPEQFELEDSDESKPKKKFQLPKIDKVAARQVLESDTAKSAVKKVLLWLRSKGVRGIKGRWEKTLDGWAGLFLKGLGIFLQVALAVREWLGADAEQEEHNRKVADAEAKARAAAVGLVGDLVQRVVADLPEICAALFDPLLGMVESRREGRDTTLEQAAGEVADLIERVDSVLVQCRRGGPAEV